MDDILTVKWDTGYANIVMKGFFPCPAAHYNRLLKLIKLDIHEEEIMQTMKDFFRKSIPVWREIYLHECEQALRYQQAEADSKARIAAKAYPNGVAFTKDELKAKKERRQFYTSHKNEAKRTALQAKKNMDWFEKRLAE